jgi:predicted transcriptional regulator of viral defense system
MSRVEIDGDIERILPGVYIGTSHPQHPLVTAAAWTLKYPKAVTCLLTAAVFHDLTDAFARGTWLYIAKGETVPRSRVAAVEVVQIAPRWIDSSRDAALGISALEIHGVRVRITNPDRTMLDLWRYPHRIPEEYALDALRRRYQAQDFYLPGLARLGKQLRIWKRIEPYLQGMALR